MQTPHRFVALLRGINVGGNNVIPMADLRRTFEAMGYADVRTYIQSGNVVFNATGEATDLVSPIEAALQQEFAYAARVAVLSAATLQRVVEQAPQGFGSQPDEYRYDVMFTLPEVTPAEVAAQLTLREGVDEMAEGDHSVYFRRLTARASHSYLTRMIKLPVYRQVTVRNWNTTTKLQQLAG